MALLRNMLNKFLMQIRKMYEEDKKHPIDIDPFFIPSVTRKKMNDIFLDIFYKREKGREEKKKK